MTAPVSRDDISEPIGKVWGWGWTGFLGLATAVPYGAAYLSTPPGHTYSWILPPYPEDSLAYLAWVRQGLDGHVLMQLKYTSISHAPFVFQPFFLFAGGICRLTGIEPGLVLVLLRILGVIFFARVVLGFLAFLRLPRRAATAALLLCGFSSGVGALLRWLLGAEITAALRPADLSVVDLDTYWSLLWNPLFPYSLSLIVGVVHCMWKGAERQSAVYWWISGFLTGLLAFVHPYHVPFLFLFFAVLTACLLRRGCWRAWIPFFVPALPPAIFVGVQSATVPLLASHSLTGSMRSPSPVALVLGCGLPLVLAAGGAISIRGRGRRLWPLVLWIGLALCLAYVPSWFQRKFLFALHLPLCILAGVGLDRLFRRSLWIWVAVGLTVPTPLYLVVSELAEVRTPDPASPYHIPNDLMRTLDFLRRNTDPADIVLASYRSSRLIPALAGNTVLWGHWAQTVDRKAQAVRLAQILNPRSQLPEAERAGVFWGSGVRYAVLDPELIAQLGGTEPRWLQESSRVVFQDGRCLVLARAAPADR